MQGAHGPLPNTVLVVQRSWMSYGLLLFANRGALSTRAALRGTIAGMLYGLSATLMKAVVEDLHAEGLGRVIAGSEPWVWLESVSMTISDSLVSSNSLTARTTSGSVVIQGAGIGNIGLLALRDTTVRGNTGTAEGSDGIAQGGGIWNASVPDGPQTKHELTLIDSSVTNNALTAAEGVPVQGGGVFTTFPSTLKDSVIAKNSPDQCYGC